LYPLWKSTPRNAVHRLFIVFVLVHLQYQKRCCTVCTANTTRRRESVVRLGRLLSMVLRQQLIPLLVVYWIAVRPTEQYTKCCAVLTIEIRESQQESVTVGDRNRSKSTALTTDNCGVLNCFQGQRTCPGVLDFLPLTKASHGMPRNRRDGLEKLRVSTRRKWQLA
jgi:hypothetical protein